MTTFISIFIYASALMIFLSCSNNQNISKAMSNEPSWLEHSAAYPEVGFVLEFKYPSDIIVSDNIDNCICVGQKTNFYDVNQSSFEDNTRQWCICVHNPDEISIDYLISSWRSSYKGNVTERWDSITIDNSEAIRIIFNSVTHETSYRQLIYMKKKSAIFEIMNVIEATETDFETFCKSISIKDTKADKH